MSALPKKLGIIAGGGILPTKLVSYCEQQNVDVFVVGFEGHVDAVTIAGRNHRLMRLGSAGTIIPLLQERGYKDLVLIGAVKRPALTDMVPDMRTIRFFAKLGMRALGDDGFLKAIRSELEDEGFTIHGVQDILPGLFIEKGVLGSIEPNDDQWEDIRIGLTGSRKIGAADIGQCVVALNGDIIGTEDDKGTNALIRCAAAKGAVLVKSSKPQQDRKLDMPTIGSDTVKLCAELGYSGIAAEAGGVLVADREETIGAANERGLFVVGV
jgi:UDP-2,3-diacylglucosamine hydrolase